RDDLVLEGMHHLLPLGVRDHLASRCEDFLDLLPGKVPDGDHVAAVERHPVRERDLRFKTFCRPSRPLSLSRRAQPLSGAVRRDGRCPRAVGPGPPGASSSSSPSSGGSTTSSSTWGSSSRAPYGSRRSGPASGCSRAPRSLRPSAENESWTGAGSGMPCSSG